MLDAGLSEDQIKFLKQKAKVDLVKKANWDIEVPKFNVLGKEWLKSQVSRAFLPNYFPDFEEYLWIVVVGGLFKEIFIGNETQYWNNSILFLHEITHDHIPNWLVFLTRKALFLPLYTNYLHF